MSSSLSFVIYVLTMLFLRDKPKGRPSFKVRKKVSFNLDVQTYEPIPADYNLLESDEEEEKEKKCRAAAKAYEGNSAELKMGSYSYPSNYRYQNCRDSYDEESEIEYEEIDLDDDDNYDDDIDDDEFYGDNDILHDQSQEDVSWRLVSANMESQKTVSSTQLTKNKTTNVVASCPSNVREWKSLELHQNVRDRSQYVHSVLNPIENLTQWKAVKARAAPPEYQRKENIEFKKTRPITDPSPFSNISQSKPLMQEIAVDTSLSNWLVLPMSNRSETTIDPLLLRPSR